MKKVKEFDKTLTQAEIDAETFLEWPNETIGRCVRATAADLKDEKGDKAILIQAAYEIIQAMMHECNAETMKAKLSGDYKGKPFKFQLRAKLEKP